MSYRFWLSSFGKIGKTMKSWGLLTGILSAENILNPDFWKLLKLEFAASDVFTFFIGVR